VDVTTLALEAVPKTIAYASLAAAAGATLVLRLLTALRQSGQAAPDPAEARACRLGRIAALALLAALLLRLTGHTVAAFGASDAFIANLSAMAIDSRWGASWRWQIGAALLLVVVTVPGRYSSDARWIAMAVAVAFCAATTPLLGHAAGSAGRVVTHAAHLLAMSAWLGTVMVVSLLTAGRAPVASGLSTALVARFSPVALAAAAVVLASGLVALCFYLTSPGDLLASTYGRILVIKLAMVAGIMACGATNWRRTRSGRPPALPVIRFEAGLALAVLAVTAVLGETAHP